VKLIPLLGLGLLWVGQFIALLVLYLAASIAMAMYMPSYVPGYDGTAAFSDVQAIVLFLLVWDRFFGPYSTLLRNVARHLRKAMRKKR